jgi:DNA-binding response OmpR family regulator
MENINKKILLVEDDLNFGAVFKDYLMLNDFDVTWQKMVWKDLKSSRKILMIYVF